MPAPKTILLVIELLHKLMLRVRRKPRVVHPGDARGVFQPLGDALGALVLTIHAHRQRLEATDEEIGRLGMEAGAVDLPEAEDAVHGVGLPAHHAAQRVGVATQELGPAVNDDPGAEGDGVLQDRRGEGVVDQDGNVAGLWDGVESSDELLERIQEMPGFGEYKARVYAAVLARQFGISPDGWEDQLPDWPNISEVNSDEERAQMKDRKKAWKDAGG